MRLKIKKIKKIKRMRRGVTLLELLVAAFMGVIIVFSSGIVLVSNQQGWQNTYNQVYGGGVTDGYVAKSAFDAVVRKSSIELRQPEVGSDGEYVTLYYYADIYSTQPDKYAMFYTTDNGELMISYGELDGVDELEPDSVVMLAGNVTYSYFSVEGSSVRMALNIDDGHHEMIELRCSAVRHTK
ncbi:hypothetical protein ACFL1G_01850 [Planctomycetota bacterium]